LVGKTRRREVMELRYIDLPLSERKKVVSLVFEEAKKMKKSRGKVNYHELSRIVLTRIGVHLQPSLIRRWLLGKVIPIRRNRLKVVRRPPDNNGQIVRGLVLTDLRSEDWYYTIKLSLGTTKEHYARSTQRLLNKYGLTAVEPVLTADMPEWFLRAYLEREDWIPELQKPLEELTYEEKMKLLSGGISGDGWITVINTNRARIGFAIALSNTRKQIIQVFHYLLQSLMIPHNLVKIRKRNRRSRIADRIIQTRAQYEYRITVYKKVAVKQLLTNLRLVEPFREIRRILALRFIERDMLDRDLVKPVWEYLRLVEKYSTIRSQIRACKLIPDERFAEKHLDKQRMLERLHRKLYEYADMVRELKPTATRIISDVRPPFTSSFSFGLFHAHLRCDPCLTCSWSAGWVCWPYA